MADYNNAEKLMAVFEMWMKPRVEMLPFKYKLMAPMLMPMLQGMMKHVSDDSIPQAAKAIIDNAVNQGCIRFDNIVIDQADLLELQKLVKLNLKCEDIPHSGYEVIIN